MIIERLIEHILLCAGIIIGFPLGASAVVSLFVSLILAATQVQEPIIPFVLRVCSAGLVLWLGGPWFVEMLKECFVGSFFSLAQLGY